MKAAALAAAALLLLAHGAAAGEDAVRVLSDRADELLERLYEDHGSVPLLDEAALLRGECLAAGATGVAEKLQGQIVYHRPGSSVDRRLYARILVSRGRVVEAVKDLRAFLKESPSDCAGHAMLADLLRSEGDAAGAAEVHESHLREHADEAGPLSALGRLRLWELRDAAGTRDAARRQRAAAEGPRATPSTAAWLRGEASFLEGEADRLEKDRVAVRASEDRVDRLLAFALAGFAALLAGAFVATGKARSTLQAAG